MAYIEEFTVRGLAGRDTVVHRKLDRHVNTFWGLNGTGKTSLLKILSSALRNDVSMLKRVPFLSAEVVFISTAHNVRIRRTLENKPGVGESEEEYSELALALEPLGDGLWRESRKEPLRSWSTEVLADKGIPDTETSFRHSYLPISRLSQVATGRNYQGSVASRSAVIDDAFLDEDFAEQVRRKWQLYFGEALSQIRIIQEQGLAAILAHLFGGASGSHPAPVESVKPEEAYKLVLEFLQEQNISLRIGKNEFVRRYENQQDLPTVVAIIQDVTDEVDQALRPQRQFRSVIQSLYSGGKEIKLDNSRTGRASFRVEWHGSVIPLQSLSSGEKQLLRLMLETLAAEDDTVMIDEPELSMHVDWQQVLVASMRRVNPDCQLLLATHSPEVMADVEDQFVFEL